MGGTIKVLDAFLIQNFIEGQKWCLPDRMLIFLIYLQQYLCKKKKQKSEIVKSNFFSHFGFAYTATNPFSFTLSLTHIYYIFFGKSRLLRLAILLPDRKSKRQLKLYLKERKDIFFIFFLKFFYYFKYCLGCWGPQRPTHPCCNFNCCCVLLCRSLTSGLSCSTESSSIDPSKILSFLLGGTWSFSRFPTSPTSSLSSSDSRIPWWNTSSLEILTEGLCFVSGQSGALHKVLPSHCVNVTMRSLLQTTIRRCQNSFFHSDVTPGLFPPCLRGLKDDLSSWLLTLAFWKLTISQANIQWKLALDLWCHPRYHSF